MEKSQRRKYIVIAVLLVLVTNAATIFLIESGLVTIGNRVVVTANSQETARGLQKLAFLKEKIDSSYYQDVDDNTLMEGAMKGLFEATGDEYSAYYNAEDFEKLMETSTGSFSGIGVVVTQDENATTTVVTPYKNTPAGNAGIEAGDKIVAVDGEDVTGKGMDYAVSLMRGEAGTPVSVTVLRGETTLTFDLTREDIDTPTVDSKNINGIGYIAITEFTLKTSEDFNTQLDELLSQNITGLVIDLRYNGGGLVTSAVAVADRLLGDTEVVYTIDKQGNRRDYKSTGDVQLDIPMVVLVNGSTASASEILSGAIQDTGAGTLVGTKTFGKGIVQDVVPLSDGSGYKVTSATYYTPNGRSIHGTGLEPDVAVEQNAEYQNTLNVPEDQDTQLQKALEVLSQ
ncbi:MAG: S41 family peptidase [Eubacterium sp.]|nr:S41 family peptidase [Eubacterium sp.]